MQKDIAPLIDKPGTTVLSRSYGSYGRSSVRARFLHTDVQVSWYTHADL